MSENSNYFF